MLEEKCCLDRKCNPPQGRQMKILIMQSSHEKHPKKLANRPFLLTQPYRSNVHFLGFVLGFENLSISRRHDRSLGKKTYELRGDGRQGITHNCQAIISFISGAKIIPMFIFYYLYIVIRSHTHTHTPNSGTNQHFIPPS